MPVGYPTTNYPNGVTNAAIGSTLQTYVLPDPTSCHTFFNDFDSFTAAQWTVTKTQGGATQAITNAEAGILALVNTTALNDLNSIQLANETFTFQTNKELWFKTKFSVTSALNTNAVIGLQITDATPLVVSDGVFFQTSVGSANLNLVVEKGSVSTAALVGTLVDATYVEVGFHYNGSSSVFIYFNGVNVGSVAVTNLPTRTLCITAAVANGTAAGQTMNVDYILASSER